MAQATAPLLDSTYGASGSLFRRSIFHRGVSVAAESATAAKPTNILLMFKAERIVTARRITAIPTKYLNKAATNNLRPKDRNSPSPYLS